MKKNDHLTAIALMRTTLPGWSLKKITEERAKLGRLSMADLAAKRAEVKAECNAQPSWREKEAISAGPFTVEHGAEVYNAKSHPVADCGAEYSGRTQTEAEANARAIVLALNAHKVMVQTLVALYCDLTSDKTADAIRRGPHVALIERTLVGALGVDLFVAVVAFARADREAAR